MTRAAWLAEVASWVGTPFRWQGRVKQDGTDCWGIIVASCWELGYIPRDWDVKSYTRRTDLVGLCQSVFPQWFDLVDIEQMQAGDIVAFHDGSPGIIHVAVLYDHEHGGLGLVHSEDWRKIVQHRMTEDQRRMIAQVWRARYEQ